MKAKWCRLYWFPRLRLPVTFHLTRDWTLTWRSVVGVQCGTVFIGMVRSTDSRHDQPWQSGIALVKEAQ